MLELFLDKRRNHIYNISSQYVALNASWNKPDAIEGRENNV